jgi:phospholipid transport system substrate-binding protein
VETIVIYATRRTRAAAALAGLFGLAFGCLAPAAFADVPSEANSSSPGEVIESLHTTLLGVMKEAEDLGYAGRCERIAPVLPDLFDIAFMVQKSVGRYWKSASEEEHQRLLRAFNKFMVANYAGNFDGYSGQSFETLGEEDSTQGTKLVLSRIVDPGGENTQLNYRLRSVGGKWKIIDIYLNGTVSELALRRSEYSSLIQREGIDSLLAALDRKVAKLSEAIPAAQSP